MSVIALALVLASALVHATWNLLAKRAGSGMPFWWLMSVLSSVIYLPLAIAIAITQRQHLGLIEFAVIAVGGALQVIYLIFLGRGYRAGDLSLVYPLARGTGPLLATLGAIILFHERPTLLTLAGIALIGVGIFTLTGNLGKLHESGALRSAAYAVLTGLTIAVYTLWDRYAVRELAIMPVFYMWGLALGQAVWLTPFALGHLDEARQAWREHRREAVGIALFNPLAYTLILIALVFSPISVIAPAREISVLIGTLMGTRLLAEGNTPRRLIAAGMMVLGIIALALS